MTGEPIQLWPDDPTPTGPFKDDDWCRFYGPDPGSMRGTTHFEVHELCLPERCSFRPEPCTFHT
jgi:hypothetical protein